MSDRAISETAMLASLRDIDLPSVAAGGLIAEIAVAAGLAGLAALFVAGLLRLFSLRRGPRAETTLASRLADLEAASPADRRVALLHLLRDHAPDRYAAIRGALYQPGAGIDTETLEAEVARLA